MSEYTICDDCHRQHKTYNISHAWGLRLCNDCFKRREDAVVRELRANSSDRKPFIPNIAYRDDSGDTMKGTAQQSEGAGEGNAPGKPDVRIYKPGDTIVEKRIAKDYSFCGYCGTQSTGVKVQVLCGNSTLLADEDVAEKLMEVKTKAEKAYWVKVCPACGFAVGVVM